MPAFEDSLPERELDLLVRWMLNDYYVSAEKSSHSEDSDHQSSTDESETEDP